MGPTTTIRPDHYENTAAARLAAQANYAPGETVGERDSADIWVRTITGWLPIRLSGAALVSVSGGYAGPRTPGANTGVSVAYTGTAGVTAAITGTLIDVLCTTAAFIAISAAGTVATTSGYYCAAGVTYRFPITTGDKVSAVQVAAGGTVYAHPVS